ncbi:Oidioi.mRNA.OKI2018_I69.chr2.g4222.t1.cds [Oikopleura dioica]|uniref:Oidioi.mRNA.OKI2018_I69.chr2.g4222.t1.cds n=1 Tax=Oikopleura dioica TaxID=34765 RepID=A0ABN7SWM9_OIKDI|nr:Oidioi.mRNA.OKI2018_I69.chr2.g4222.t1.cds [Oikopleura dioica]
MVLEDIVDSSDLDKEKGMEWYQLIACLVQASFYCVAFYYTSLILTERKFLSKTLKIDEDFSIVREIICIGLSYLLWLPIPALTSLFVGPKSDRWEKIYVNENGEEIKEGEDEEEDEEYLDEYQGGLKEE